MSNQMKSGDKLLPRILWTLRIILILTAMTLVLTACPAPKPPPEPPPPPVSQGTSAPLMVKLTVDELTALASNIVVGRVTGTSSQWNADRTTIYTMVTISVEEQIKGSWNKPEIIVPVPGGQVEAVTQAIEDSPSFRAGERALVFLEIYDSAFRVVGGFQGKFVIGNDGKVTGSNLSLPEFIAQIKTTIGRAPK